METLESRINYKFKNIGLLKTALTHSSYVNEHPREHAECYERLEFLGDSILGMVTAELLFRWAPSLPEGKMARIRAELVCEESLHHVAIEQGLGQWMRLGRGEENSNGRERPSILADMVEAVIAAIYLDGGMESATRFIRRCVLNHADDFILNRSRDNKTELQEIVQQQTGSTIRYEMTGESGPDHNKRFSYAVYVNEVLAGEGEGRTKKEAEQAAAGSALQQMTP